MIFTAIFLWMVLELHKITFAYFPPRYQVSLFFSVGLMSCVVIYHALFSADSTVRKKIIVCILLAAFFFVNAAGYYGLNSRRQYLIEEMNDYMKHTVHDSRQAILGIWAPAITWESKSRAIPVWNDFLNDKKSLTVFKPVSGVIVEPDNQSSVDAFTHQGVDLKAISDSVKQFSIGRSNLNLYWIKPQE